MDMYGISAPVDFFPVDDLLDFSNDELLSPATTPTDSDFAHHHDHQIPLSETPSATIHFPSSGFSDHLCVPNDDVAELEWLSNFVDDSFSDFPANSITAGTASFRSDMSFNGRSRSKRSRATSSIINGGWTSSPESDAPPPTMARCKSTKATVKRGGNSSREPPVGRKCTHCASEKTPQWRTGPLGPKTLCNACGVRFKSGRLVPEYRPAASPTFVLTQHSNSHRKVLELRRQKELHREIQLEDFGVC